MTTISPIDELRQVIKIEEVERSRFFGLQEGRVPLPGLEVAGTFREDVLSRPTNAWAFDIAKWNRLSDLSTKEHAVLVKALQRASRNNKNVFARAVEQSGIPTRGTYYPLMKAYKNAAEYDQHAIAAIIRMIEYSSSLQAEEALPEAAR